jgi:hypothetical protein
MWENEDWTGGHIITQTLLCFVSRESNIFLSLDSLSHIPHPFNRAIRQENSIEREWKAVASFYPRFCCICITSPSPSTLFCEQ